MTLTTGYGDVLDTLCYHAYVHLNGTVEAVLDANQGMADEPQPYRAGIVIELPDLPAPDDSEVMLCG
ncbi:tail protein X [Pseudomonas sp. COW5]|uniref:tail protein X n=1 Tax=Pseudomonas sp. COW5 TaxID=2981253 RepID=UPI00224680B2|nr:tail protein X [Pseudomonas sp. COW5]MCX2542064.1 tail protein X [Pseudomonas sp. COW5]